MTLRFLQDVIRVKGQEVKVLVQDFKRLIEGRGKKFSFVVIQLQEAMRY